MRPVLVFKAGLARSHCTVNRHFPVINFGKRLQQYGCFKSTDTVFLSYIFVVGIVTAAVFSGIIAFGVVFLVMYFVRKKRTVSHSDNGNGIYPNKYYLNVVLKVASSS